MKPANPPWRHHYIPCFLLEHWVDPEDGRLGVFRRPREKVEFKRKAPAAIGYEPYLYSIPGVAPDKAQQLETNFFQHVDSRAAVALAKMMELGSVALDRVDRSSWSRFVMSLWFRTPDNLSFWTSAMGELLERPDADMRRRYEAIRQPGDPDTFEAAMAMRNPGWSTAAAMMLLSRFIDDPDRGARLNAMIWEIIHVDRGNGFVVSDQPIVMTDALGHMDAHIAVPIGPDRLFVAVNHPRSLDALRSHSAGDVVEEMNALVAGQARLFVGARDQAWADSIQRHFATRGNNSVVARMARRYARQERN